MKTMNFPDRVRARRAAALERRLAGARWLAGEPRVQVLKEVKNLRTLLAAK